MVKILKFAVMEEFSNKKQLDPAEVALSELNEVPKVDFYPYFILYILFYFILPFIFNFRLF